MGLSRAALMVRGAPKESMVTLAKNLGLLGPGAAMAREVSDQSEIGEGDYGVCSIGGWGMLFSSSRPYLENELTEALSDISCEHDVFFWLTQSTVAALWFEYHEKGKLRRKWVEAESEVHVNEGSPLAQEPPGLFSGARDEEGIRDELRVLELADEITGVSVASVFETPFDVYASGL